MSGVNGTFVTELDGVEYYTDGVKHAGTSFQVSIAYVDFAREYDSISNSGAWTVGSSSRFPVANVDNNGRVTFDVLPGAFDIGVVRYADGTFGVHGGVGVGGPLLGASFSIHGGGASSGPYGNLSTYDHIEVYSDGTLVNVEHSPGNAEYPHVQVTRTYHLPDGTTHTEYTNVADIQMAADMSAGIAPHIYEDDAFWGGDSNCFLPGTLIDMWPTDPLLKPGVDGKYDEERLMAKVWKKPIEEVIPNDTVLSYDGNGNLQPGRVAQSFENTAMHILDFWGTGVTSGHAYLCGEGQFKGQHVPLIDILRSDGAIVGVNGSLIRAATGSDMGSESDLLVHAIALGAKGVGLWVPTEEGFVRTGTRVLTEDGDDVSVLELISSTGGELTEDGYVFDAKTGETAPFLWRFGATLPKPEDYVLQRSNVTLEEIYAAGEWEQTGSRMPGPKSFDLDVILDGNLLLAPEPVWPNMPNAFLDQTGSEDGSAGRNPSKFDGHSPSHTSGHSVDAALRSKWAVHNFEVEGHHTYVADGNRVHNTSYARVEDYSNLDEDDNPTISYETSQFDLITVDEEGNRTYTLNNPDGPNGSYTMPTSTPDDAWATEPEARQPLVIDLDGDGVEISGTSSVYFDWDDDGYLEQTSWVGADDGFLVLDLNEDGTRGDGDGQIDQARELAFALWGDEGDTDLQALRRAFDDNDDGVLDSNDGVWDELRIWQDANQNGVVDDGELMSLDEVEVTYLDANGNTQTRTGITEIDLGYDDGSDYADTDDDISVFGNTLHGLASFTLTGDHVVEGGVGDVSLGYNALGWRDVDTELGYNIEFESGVQYRYAVIDENDADDVDLTAANLNGAAGDDDNNILTAAGHILAVAVSGAGGNDTITGGVQDDMLSGDAGDDELRGGAGDDLIFFDADDTVVEGGSGYDTAYVATEDTVTLDLVATGFEQAFGNDGDDVFTAASSYIDIALHGGEGNDSLTGGNSDDILSGDGGDDVLSGGYGNDYATGGAGNDSIDGGFGDDLIFGGDGADTLDGGTNDDMVFGNDGNDDLAGGTGDDFVDGGEGDDTIDGGNHDDLLIGGAGNDHIHDGEGDDHMEGGEGDDHFWQTDVGSNQSYEEVLGGTGSDTLHLTGHRDDWTWEYVGSTRQVVVDSWRGGPDDETFYVYETQAYSTGQYMFTNGTQYIDVMDVETVQFADGGADLALANTSSVEDNSDEFERSSQTSINTVDQSGTYAPGTWTGGGTDDSFISTVAKTSHHDEDNDPYNYGATGDETFDGESGSDAVHAGAGDDSLIGGSGADGLWGEDGNDTLEGGSGTDYLHGGDGQDVLNGDTGTDNLFGGAGNDLLNGDAGSDFLLGEDGHDTIYGGSGHDIVGGGQHDDLIYGEDGSDRLYGEEGHDTLSGGMSDDQLYGGDGHDLLNGDTDNDLLAGGTGSDTLDGGQGQDILIGEDGADSLIGGWDDDALYGGTGNDTLAGGNGADYLEGGAGVDSMDGGAGSLDVIGYSESTAGVTVDLSLGTATGGHATGDVFVGVEGVLGSDFADNLTGDAGNNFLFGEDGNDSLTGANGRDVLSGGSGDDILLGGNGTDTLYGGEGNDTLDAGAGEAGQQLLDGGDGNDSINGGGQEDFLFGGTGDDTLTGLNGNDTLSAQDGNDEIDAGWGADQIDGGAGDDLLTGAGGSDTFVFADGHGNDTITDFNAINALELIDLSGLTNSDDVQWSQVGSDILVDTADGNSILLLDVSLAAMGSEDFIFA